MSLRKGLTIPNHMTLSCSDTVAVKYVKGSLGMPVSHYYTGIKSTISEATWITRPGLQCHYNIYGDIYMKQQTLNILPIVRPFVSLIC